MIEPDDIKRRVDCALAVAESFGPDMGDAQALDVLAMLRVAMGIACPKCGGRGVRPYGDTSTWRPHCGGQSITEDTCDKCWGAGRQDRKGRDLRRMVLGG